MSWLFDAWTLARKDLRVFLRDRMALVLTFLVPIALVTMFGWIMTFAFSGGGGMPKVTLWVVDLAQNEASKNAIASLRESEMLKLLPDDSAPPITTERMRSMIADGDAHHGVVFPSNYGKRNENDELVDIQLLRDPGREMESRIIQIALLQNSFTSGAEAWQHTMRRMLKKSGIDGTALTIIENSMIRTQSDIELALETSEADKPRTESSPASVPGSNSSNRPKEKFDPMKTLGEAVSMQTEEIRPAARSKRVTYQQAQSVSGMAVMMLLFGLTGAGALLLAERESGTLRRLFAVPIARESILIGKFLFVAIIGLIQMVVLFVYGELMFRVGIFRDPITLAVLIVSWVAAASGFAMFIATFCKSAKQADGLATVLILVMAALGGCWFPLQMLDLPLPMQIATRSMMTYWAMEGFQGMLWNGLSLLDSKILRAIGIQWLWASGLMAIAIYLYRRSYMTS